MIGVMQGRLSPPLSAKIQEFPWKSWESEFATSSKLGIKLMEWTLDLYRLQENPLMTEVGQTRIRDLSTKNKIDIQSVTLDCFVEAPLHRKHFKTGEKSESETFIKIISQASNLGITIGVLPLVKESGEDDERTLSSLFTLLGHLEKTCSEYTFRIALECEFDSKKLKWIASEVKEMAHVGFNFDIGNSASIGNDPFEELAIYGQKLFNIHIKDRVLGGTTEIGRAHV